jgi:hypothetical protein
MTGLRFTLGMRRLRSLSLNIPVVTETIVTVLKFEHREKAEILVQTAFFVLKKFEHTIFDILSQ